MEHATNSSIKANMSTSLVNPSPLEGKGISSQEPRDSTANPASKQEEMTQDRRRTDPEGHAPSSTNANPLFRLVNAAASILEPSDKEGRVSTAEDTEMTPTEEETTPASVTNEKTLLSSDASEPAGKKEQTKDTNSPAPNVLRGTKEDLMLDPKIKISFGEHLYNVLENEEHHDVLNWMPDGKSFTIVNHKQFVLKKMPTLFQIRNMSSFVRKLGRWGFSRVFEKETNNSDVFKHPHFVRGDRAGIRKHVKCLGRSAAPKQQTHAPRQPDFVVRQEPGKPPMVMHTGRGSPIPASLMSQIQFQPPTEPLRNRTDSMKTPYKGSLYPGGPSSLDEVANASAASAEALYLSHQQHQKVKMEQLASADQQRLEDMEIERLMKRREMRQQQKVQQQYFLEQQRRLMIEKNAGSPRSSGAGKQSSAATVIGKSSMPGQHLDGSMSGSSRGSVMPTPRQIHHDSLQSNALSLGSIQGMDLRRVSMQHAATSSLDGSLGRSASSRFSVGSEGVVHQVTPTSMYDTRKVLTAAYETLQRDEMRSRERQAAIRALLAEEQEFEARRRAAYGSPAAAPYMRG